MESTQPKKLSTERKLLLGIFATCGMLILGAVLVCNIPASTLGIHYQETVSFAGAKVEYFDIGGNSWNTWTESIQKVNAGGPEDGKSAWTSWLPGADWKCDNNIIENMRVDPKITVHLPRPDLSNASLLELYQWKQFLGILVSQEAHHVEIFNSHIIDFQGINGMDCQAGLTMFGTIFQNIVQLNKN